MARYAMVSDVNGIVVNVIEWNGDPAIWSPPPGYTMVEDAEGAASPGYSYADGAFTPPPGGTPGGGEAT